MSRLLFSAMETAATVPEIPPPLADPPPRPAVVTSPFSALVAAVDRSVFTLLGSTTITWQPGNDGPPLEITGIFDSVYILARGDAEAGVETLGPAAFVRLDDLPDAPEDDDPTLTIAGVDYRVVERRPDGMGGVVLALRMIV